MGVGIIFETHSISEDNENGIPTGWLDGRLSARGRDLAAALGERRRRSGIEAVFTSDQGRAVETARIAFAGSDLPHFIDWRLRECNYGMLNGQPGGELRRCGLRYLDEPHPGGESWRQAVERVGRFLPDLHCGWNGRRVLVIGHRATRYAFEHLLIGTALEDLIDEAFEWQEGWEYFLP